MKTKLAALGCLMFACGAVVASLASGRPAQEIKHAPTVAQCQADQRLWLSKLEDSASASSVSYNTLADWVDEMGDCAKVDPAGHSLYENVEAEAVEIIMVRYLRYLHRHHLYEQFVAEDEAGVGR
jgi:hypothetical protein